MSKSGSSAGSKSGGARPGTRSDKGAKSRAPGMGPGRAPGVPGKDKTNPTAGLTPTQKAAYEKDRAASQARISGAGGAHGGADKGRLGVGSHPHKGAPVSDARARAMASQKSFGEGGRHTVGASKPSKSAARNAEKAAAARARMANKGARKKARGTK